MIRSNTGEELRKILDLSQEEPVAELLSSFHGTGAAHDRKKQPFIIGSTGIRSFPMQSWPSGVTDGIGCSEAAKGNCCGTFLQ